MTENDFSDKERRYHLGERGLESLERRYLDGMKMQRLINKLSERHDVQFIPPKFVPVYVSGRLKRNDGLHYFDKIVIRKDVRSSTKYLRRLLWHEIIHSFVTDNYPILYESEQRKGTIPPSTCESFEREVFRYATKDGSHDSHVWKLSCDCGMWLKSMKRQKHWFCPRCHKTLIGKNQYWKYKRIHAIDSKMIDLDHYKIWKSNKKIGD